MKPPEKKKQIEKELERFEQTPIRHIWDVNDLKEMYPKWYVLEFGKWCWQECLEEVKKLIDELEYEVNDDCGEPDCDAISHQKVVVESEELKSKIQELKDEN